MKNFEEKLDILTRMVGETNRKIDTLDSRFVPQSVCAAYREVEEARNKPTRDLFNEIIRYVIMAVIGAALSYVVVTKGG